VKWRKCTFFFTHVQRSFSLDICLLALYVVWAFRHAHPAVDLKVLRHPQPALAVGLSALVAIVLFVMLFLLTPRLTLILSIASFTALSSPCVCSWRR
jgi:hypothetical protein